MRKLLPAPDSVSLSQTFTKCDPKEVNVNTRKEKNYFPVDSSEVFKAARNVVFLMSLEREISDQREVRCQR